MTNWARKRQLSLAAHLLFGFVPLAVGTVAAFTVWSALFGSWQPAAILLGTLEILAIASLILYIAHIEWPLAWVRHLIPFLSMVPLGYELYRLLEPNGWAIAGSLALAVTGWFVYLSYCLFRSLEGLFIDPIEAARERAYTEMQSLRLTLSVWEEASKAVHGFANAVHTVQPRIHDVQPSMPLLTAQPTSHPKMRLIATLAQVKAAEGGWALDEATIQQQTRVDAHTVHVLVTLVRSGQLVLTEGSNDA